MLKSSISKIYISLCASGEVDKLHEFITKNPGIHLYKNPRSSRNNSEVDGLFYAIRNLKIKTTNFLVKKGFEISPATIKSLIHSHWRGSFESYLFLQECGITIYGTQPPVLPYGAWLFTTYVDYCLSNHNLKKIFKILNHTEQLNKASITLLIDKYTQGGYNKTNRNYIANLRELQLSLLLSEE